jgi:hypothetical protein
LLVCLHIVVIDRRDYFLVSFVENSALHCGVFEENVDEWFVYLGVIKASTNENTTPGVWFAECMCATTDASVGKCKSLYKSDVEAFFSPISISDCGKTSGENVENVAE